MKLSLADKIALIYTSAGNQTAVGKLTGLSHQQIGRFLKTGYEGGYSPDSRVFKNKETIAKVNAAFEEHIKLAKAQAKADGLPFTRELPVYAKRLLHSDGTKGARVSATNTHWLSNRFRNAWISFKQKSGKYYAASVLSMVDLRIYNKRAEKAFKGAARTETQRLYRSQIANMINNGVEFKKIATPYTTMNPNLPSNLVIRDIDEKLKQRHEPATGERGTKLAAEILLQVDTRGEKNASAKQRKTRSDKGKPRKPKAS